MSYKILKLAERSLAITDEIIAMSAELRRLQKTIAIEQQAELTRSGLTLLDGGQLAPVPFRERLNGLEEASIV